jgi:hypothetical protein
MLRLFERKDLAPVRLGLEHRFFKVLEKLPCDPRTLGIVDGGDLKLDAGHTLEGADRRQQHHKLALTLSKEPEAVLQTTDRFKIADIDFLILRRDRHGWVVLAIDQAAGQLNSFMRVFLPHAAEVRD